MKALVTGGGGFLGGEIVRQLLERSWKVRSFSRSRYPRLEALGVEQTPGDLSDGERVAAACEGCRVVFHVAAKAGIGLREREFFEANVIGTRNVLAGCSRAGVRRLVYTSSPSVVFDGSDMEGVDESAPYPERHDAPYPRTKAQAEREVLAASAADCRTIALRPHLIWGPGDTHILPGLIERARRGRLRQVGDGTNRADFTYVEDAARAHLLAADALANEDGPAGRPFFITQGEPVLLWDFVNRMLEAAGAPQVTGRLPAGLAMAAGRLMEMVYGGLRLRGDPPITRFLAGEMATTHWFDISAARRQLGYQPQVTIEEGLQRLREWFRSRGS